MYYKSFEEFVHSILITFVASFAVAFLPFLGGNDLSHSAIVGGVMVAARAAVVAVLTILASMKKSLS